MEGSTSPEALDRKRKSESVLRSEGVPLNLHLPPIETQAESRRRSAEEVAFRTLALLTVAVKGEGLEHDVVQRVIAEYGLAPYFTPKEQAFIQSRVPSRQDRVQFSWRYEAAWVLLWAQNYVEKLEKPVSICDVPRAVSLMRDRSTQQFVKSARLRAQSELLDWADRIYRYHWAVTDARIKGKEAPAALEAGVTLERHYALNWLVGYMDQAWDEISTDT